MGWRILHIGKPCKLSIKNSQLIYEAQENETLSLPLEDISVIILENRQISLNNTLLSQIADYNIVLFTCDAFHMPSGVLFPFHQHSRYSDMAWQQIAVSEPLKKRIWQEIIKAKINNQAICLELFRRENALKLKEVAKLVQSGDAKNAEAFAANLYWKSLFNNFNRNNDKDIRNAALNYGYAIIRGCVARNVVGAGLLPCFGVHHANKLNQFNLVDDLMEPLRPFVDYVVNLLDFNQISELKPDIKSDLVGVLTQNCRLNNEIMTVVKACELMAYSLANVIKNRDIKYLQLPTFDLSKIF